MKLQNKKGFTLIELLVVITIIGILATGATATYTSQIQKARDTTRINDLKSVQSAVEQYYGDKSDYPNIVNSGSLKSYIGLIPKEQKSGSGASGATLGYAYATGSLDNVTYQRFELSTAFENLSNVDNKAVDTKDNGNEPIRYEIGVPSNTSGKLDQTTSIPNYTYN